uniref:Uncharacterized protein n=1 Tax=Arundo donax TaxID=35708 RepID=A0A0A8ZBN8_ARUDO
MLRDKRTTSLTLVKMNQTTILPLKTRSSMRIRDSPTLNTPVGVGSLA